MNILEIFLTNLNVNTALVLCAIIVCVTVGLGGIVAFFNSSRQDKYKMQQIQFEGDNKVKLTEMNNQYNLLQEQQKLRATAIPHHRDGIDHDA